jgi:alkanesulfonate monooxygenase SsuD/methylene tetrahydromethanopterin reductase-like flavin-dependent oxidoreductase (luciferase family)
VRFGLNFPLSGLFSDISLVSELAKEAEACGWDGCFVWDHLRIAGTESNSDPWLALALIVHATNRITIGPLVTPIFRRHLGKLAQETVTLDHLSNGRLIMGIGLGSDEFGEISAFGGPLDDLVRSEMLDEGLQILTEFWSGQRVTFEGKHYRIRDAQILPACFQSPRIPIWVAASWGRKRPMRRAARFDGLVTVRGDMASSLTPAATEEMVSYVRGIRTSRSPFEVVHFGHIGEVPVDEVRTYVESYADAGVTWWIETFAFGSQDIDQIRAQIRRGPLV